MLRFSEGHEGGVLITWLGPLQKRYQRAYGFSPSNMWGHSEKAVCKTQKESSHQKQTMLAPYLNLDFKSPGLFKPCSLCMVFLLEQTKKTNSRALWNITSLEYIGLSPKILINYWLLLMFLFTLLKVTIFKIIIYTLYFHKIWYVRNIFSQFYV